MGQDRTPVRVAAGPERRPVARNAAREQRGVVAASPARALRQRLGNYGTQQVIARSALAGVRATPTPANAVGPAMPTLGAVSSPHEPAEREAADTARKVVQMSPPSAAPQVERVGPGVVSRRGAAANPAPPSPPAELGAGVSGGAQLPPDVRAFMEPRFGARFDHVRIHTDGPAARMSEQLGAQAFTVGSHVFFGGNRFQPGSGEGRELIAHELTHVIQQGASVQRSEDATVTRRSPIRVQRLGVSDALDYIADKANYIPGFRMLTIALGVNPINMAPVERSAANILRALIEFIPGGALIAQALGNYGIFDKAGAWIETQVRALGATGSALKQALLKFLDSLSWTDIFDLGGVWERGKRIFTEPIDRLINLAKSAAVEILKFIRDAILMPLAKLAQGTRGYDLLRAVLGQDPISGEPVPRTPETLIGGFMKLIGQEEVWENIKKANAIPRAWAWFQGALAGLMGFVRQIPTLFMNALRSLEIIDLVLPPKAFVKLVGVFGGVVGAFLSWAGGTVLQLLLLVFEVVSPRALVYLKRTGAALLGILKNPLPFVSNLVKAAKLGFLNFADHFLQHLKAGLIDWLTGSLPGIYIPKAFTLQEIVKFVLSVLGLSWANIRLKLVKAVGEPAVKAMETGFDIVVTLVREGPAAAWDKIKEQLANLKDMVIGGITDFVVDMVVKKAIPKLIAMFIPGAGFISAILSIYDTIMVFVNKLAKIAQVVKAFVDSIVAIAGGAIAAAAARVENTLAGLLSLAISFLAGFAGLGKVSDKVMEVINKVRAPIDKALDWLVNWIVQAAKRLGKLVAQAGVPQDPLERLKLGRQAGLAAINKFAGKPVAGGVLAPLLAGIAVRYGFARLEAVPQRGRWHLVGRINPDLNEATDALTPAEVAPGAGQATLLIGEGNFSFALSIAVKTQVGGRLVATDYVVEERKALEKTAAEQKRNEVTAANVAKLGQLGVEVERQVDARNPASYPEGSFEVIVFNHPFVHTRVDGKVARGGEKENVKLVTNFLAAAKQKIKEGGKIIIISSGFRLQRWKLDQIAAALNLEQKVLTFLAANFPGYVHEETEAAAGAETVQTKEQFAIVFTVKSATSK